MLNPKLFKIFNSKRVRSYRGKWAVYLPNALTNVGDIPTGSFVELMGEPIGPPKSQVVTVEGQHSSKQFDVMFDDLKIVITK